MQTLSVPVKRIDEKLAMPAYAHEGDAGIDLRAAEDAVLMPFQRKLISCGIAIAIPQHYAGFVVPRSGLAAKNGISVVNAPGLIDSNYRGEIKVILINLDPEETFEVHCGDRIAQLVIMSTPHVQMIEVEELDDTDRGTGGFGSTGV